MSPKVLYIEDEEHLASIVKETMELKGYTVKHCKEGTKMLSVISNFKPDVCVLDVMLPYIDGFSLGLIIRKVHPQLPIIFLTAKSQVKDVLEGFASGGTDYLKKPFSMEELMARIDSQLKLSGYIHNKADQDDKTQQIRLGSFTYIPSKLELHNEDLIIKLSNREAEIMHVFCTHLNSVIDRRMLMHKIWGDDSYFISRNLDVYVKKLRHYFASGKGVEIITLKGKGYQFSVVEY